MNLKKAIEKLMHRENLDQDECRAALDDLLKEGTCPLQSAAFLVLLRTKGETPEELVACVESLQQKMIQVPVPYPVLDIVGTGGDGGHTINLSTGSAILAASCGIKIAKHGNRAVSSLTGSADVLSALGIEINLPPEKIIKSIDEIGIGFCYSPNFHPMMQSLRALRKQLNVPTTFNLLGPLLNPARPTHQLLGVYHAKLMPLMANALTHLKVGRSMVVHGHGLDEVSCLSPSSIIEINHGKQTTFEIDSTEFGFARCTLKALQGGDANTNAEIMRDIFSGKNKHQTEAMAHSMILNAGLSLVLYGRHALLKEAIQEASQQLNNGAALTLLNNWIECSHA